MRANHTCETCEVVFVSARATSRFCSHACRDEACRKTYPTRICEICGESFTRESLGPGAARIEMGRWVERKYCSPPCARSSQIKPVASSTCNYCKLPFWGLASYVSKRQFCSPRCKKAASNRGKTTAARKFRDSREYAAWRTAVFERDDYTCVLCGTRGGEMAADHIKSFAFHSELRLDLDNGRTLCTPCHRETDNYGARAILIETKETSCPR